MFEIGKAIKDILSRKLPDGWNIKRYSDENDFKSLWELGNCKLESKKILVIWDGFPNNDYSDNDPCQHINLEQFITPIDWALKHLIKHTKVNIIILDIRSREFRYQDDTIKKLHKGILDQLKEHVSYYSFYVKNFGNITKLSHKLLEDTESQENTQPQVGEACLDEFFGKRKKTIIDYSYKNEENHHNVDNILGAVLLKAEKLPAEVFKQTQIKGRASIHGKVFIQSFHIDENEHEEPDFSYNLEDTNLVLVDDQAEYDWIELLCGWVYGECPNTEEDNGCYKVHKKKKDDKGLIYSATGKGDYGYASLLIKKLEKTIENLKKNNDSDKLRDGRFFFNFIGNGIKDEILIFDLYLFPKDPDKEKKYLLKEKKYLLKVFELAEGLSLDLSREDQQALEILQSKDGNIREETCYIHCVTLLPRLIAQIDPSIPIMVFSATRSITLTSLLKDYMNIFEIRKPEFSNSHNRIELSMTLGQFHSGLEKAIKFIKVRKRLRELLEHYLKMSNAIERRSIVTEERSINNPPVQNKKIVLYTDETGSLGEDDYFAIGGFYLIYDQNWENNKEAWKNQVLNFSTVANQNDALIRKFCLNEQINLFQKDKDRLRKKLLSSIQVPVNNSAYPSNISVQVNNSSYPLRGIKIVAKRPDFEQELDNNQIGEAIRYFIRAIFKAYNNNVPDDNTIENLQNQIDRGKFISAWQIGKISDDYIRENARVLIQQNTPPNRVVLKNFHTKFNRLIENLAITEEIAKRFNSLIRLYRDMVQQLLELFLCVLLPIQDIEEGTTITIVCAKREAVCYPAIKDLQDEFLSVNFLKKGGYYSIPCLHKDTSFDLMEKITEKNELPFSGVTANVIGMEDGDADFIHHMADAVLCTTEVVTGKTRKVINKELTKKTDLLFDYPGMKVDNVEYVATNKINELYKFEVVDPFIKANEKLWEKDDKRYVNALSIIIEDKVWFEFKKSIENKKPDKLTNDITSCICYLLAKKACREISAKGIYDLVAKQDKDVNIAAPDLEQDKGVNIAAPDLEQDKDVNIAASDLEQDKGVNIAAPDLEQDKDVNIAALDSEQDKDVNESISLSTSKPADTYKVSDTFRDCAACPEMVVVPSGSFMMGSPADESGRYGSEGPQHRVTIPKPFAVGKYAVTRGQFEEFANEEKHPDNKWRNPGFNQSANHPVVKVSWEDAKAYTVWLSAKTGQNYRLLSEAEWEYVARAGMATAYHFGATISQNQANYGKAGQGTVEVGSYPENAFGLHDMHGNVWEWVEDCWHDDYNSAPSDGSAWTGDCDRGPQYRVLRGGSWIRPAWILRSANRGRNGARDRSDDYGFRIARTLSPV